MQSDFSAPQPNSNAGNQPSVPIGHGPSAPQPAAAGAGGQAAENQDKSFLLATVFSTAGGYLGADRWYLGYKLLAVLKLLTFGGLYIWWLVDLILLLTGKLRQKGNPAPLEGYGRYKDQTVKGVLILILAAIVWTGILTTIYIALAFALSSVVGTDLETTGPGTSLQESYSDDILSQ